MISFTFNEQAATYLRLIRQWWWLPVLFGILSGVFTYAGTKTLMHPVYASHLKLQVVSTSGSQNTGGADANTDAILMMTVPVKRQAAEAAKGITPAGISALAGAICFADDSDKFI